MKLVGKSLIIAGALFLTGLIFIGVGIGFLASGTKDNNGITFSIALNYGGRDEIVNAVKNIVIDFKNGKYASLFPCPPTGKISLSRLYFPRYCAFAYKWYS